MPYRILEPVLAAVLLAPGVAEAAEYSLFYQAPEGCPSREQMSEEILARADTARVAAHWPDYVFKASILPGEGTSVVGELTIEPRDGLSSVRKVDGLSCEEVVSALALIAALTLDPNARLGPVEAHPAAPSVSGALSPKVTAVEPPAAESQPASEPAQPRQQPAPTLPTPAPAYGVPRTLQQPPAQPRRVRHDPPSARRGPRTPVKPWEPSPGARVAALAVGAHGGYLTQLAPNGLFVLGLDGELRHDAGPYVELSLELGPRNTQGNEHGESASFFYWGTELLAGSRVARLGPFSVDMGGLVAGGRMWGRAEERGRVTEASPAQAWFVGTGPSARLSWHAPGLILAAGAAATVSLSRPRFDLEFGDRTKEAFFTTPACGGMARLEGLFGP